MSTQGKRIALEVARKYAVKIVRVLRPLCVRIRVAGSARRKRPTCGDIDFVVELGDIPAFQARVAEKCRIVLDGHRNFEAESPNGIRLSFYICEQPVADLFGNRDRSPWGSLLLCRTGSTSHNCRIALAAKMRGWHWDPYRGLIEGWKVIAGATEREVFSALGLEWVHPRRRE